MHPLPFDPRSLPRETRRHYISASDADISAMLETVGARNLDALYQHIPAACRFAEPPALPEEVSYEELQRQLLALAGENRVCESYIGDGLPHYEVMPIVAEVCAIRNLTTAYTPYQPERSQGTLMTHWIYQCLMSQLTGFEAINSSLYDRSTAIFEAMATAVRLSRKGGDIILVSEGIYPGDREVVETLLPGTGIRAEWIPLDPHTGRTDTARALALLKAHGDAVAGLVFPQVNCLGLLEDVDALADLTAGTSACSIAVIDPMLLGTGGLKPPTQFGANGVDMIVGEAQHLAIGPNFGGPGLGVFGVRFNEANRNAIRQTPGRYVGKARDLGGRDCHVMVLSTREQHIRKDKATSNICSNQAFLATLAGAAILARGESGMAEAFAAGRQQAVTAARMLVACNGMRLAFPQTPFVNEIVLETTTPAADLIEKARQAGIHLGVDVSGRAPGQRHLLKLSFSDRPMDLERLARFFADNGLGPSHQAPALPELPDTARRRAPAGLPQLAPAEVSAYYRKLGELNVSPDDACYPLGSCTMKYNPFINDWAAGLPGFTDVHPQAPAADAQGCLRLLHEIQEWFKKITGLAGITTQPVAGAQGELVGLKLFQAYHADHGQGHRDVMLIPASAHGTNFATAVMAGYHSGKAADGRQTGIVLLGSAPDGTIDMDDLRAKVALHRDHLAGIMVTNPNTCGVFETRFREIAALVHEAGGLVYMDGANMNAIAGWCDLGAMGVDAVHNNLHKTWTIPHGGGGPGDAIVGVSARLLPYLPGHQVELRDGRYVPVKPPKSIGSFHRHWGNFAHKVRAYTYLLRLGRQGVPRVTAMAVLSSRYCFEKLRAVYPSLPAGAGATPRMHEFILTLREDDFARIEAAGVPRALAVTRVGKLFLDFGFHAPTVAWPEAFGLMIEPTESYSKAELDRFCEAVLAIYQILQENPEVLNKVPLFTPVDRVDEVEANRKLTLNEPIRGLPAILPNRLSPTAIARLPIAEVRRRILEAAR